jgi:TfoX/Sxy family transcriptional regulator of competence genes
MRVKLGFSSQLIYIYIYMYIYILDGKCLIKGTEQNVLDVREEMKEKWKKKLRNKSFVIYSSHNISLE